MHKRFAVLLAALTLPLTAHATILPPNDLYKEDNLYRENAQIDEATFNKIANDIVAIYKPIAQKMGAYDLVTINDWTDPTVNAYATRNGGTWEIHMFGGLARRPEITPDGFAMVVCHELGHHLGGFPRYSNNTDWAANEGQADYFATLVCAKRIWGDHGLEIGSFDGAVDPTPKRECDAVYRTQQGRDICYRSAMAGKSLATLLNNGVAPSFDKRDTTIRSKTMDEHPAGQCRFDTYYAGALCWKHRPDESELITTEAADVEVSCTQKADSKGYKFWDRWQTRPRCWFAPKLR